MPDQTLIFATLNLNNLQKEGEYAFTHKVTAEEYKSKIAWTAGIIRETQADIIGFQELWHKDCLEKAVEDADLSAKYTVYADEADGGTQTIALAVKTALQVNNIQWIRDLPDELVLKKRPSSGDDNVEVKLVGFRRPVIRAEIKPEKGPDIVLFVAHLKSKLPTKLDSQEKNDPAVKPHSIALGSALATIRRTAEATALRIMLNKEMKDSHTPTVVMGDLNDSQLGVITSIVTAQPPYRMYEKSRTAYASDLGMYSVATLQEYRSLRDVYYTYLHQGQRESLDHILVSEQFYDNSQNRVWSFREARVINDHLVDKNSPWNKVVGGNDPGWSDHGVICAIFDHNPAK